MSKHILPPTPITGEFRYLYASASGIDQKTKRLYITSNITESEEFVSYDVEYDGKIFPFAEWKYAVEFYNKK